jgi:hypothetical protein
LGSWRYGDKTKSATIYVDQDVLRAAKVRAAREGRHHYDVVEAALRHYLGFDVIDRIRQHHPEVGEATVMAEALAAVHEVRAERRAAHPPLG